MQKRRRVFLALNLHVRREKPSNPCFWNKTSEQPKHQILQIREQVSFNFSEIWNFLLSDQKCLKENLLILNLQQQWRWVYPALQEASWTPAKCACRVWMTDPWSSWCWVVHWRLPSATSAHPEPLPLFPHQCFPLVHVARYHRMLVKQHRWAVQGNASLGLALGWVWSLGNQEGVTIDGLDISWIFSIPRRAGDHEKDHAPSAMCDTSEG